MQEQQEETDLFFAWTNLTILKSFYAIYMNMHLYNRYKKNLKFSLKKMKTKFLNFRIDKLTSSIENRISGELKATKTILVTQTELNRFNKKNKWKPLNNQLNRLHQSQTSR